MVYLIKIIQGLEDCRVYYVLGVEPLVYLTKMLQGLVPNCVL